jgi:A/G-specific adenine glycosylase
MVQVTPVAAGLGPCDAGKRRVAAMTSLANNESMAPAAALLAWYDRHRRRLPWRVLPGEVPDPYRIWLSEVMLQQTTVQAVKPYFERFVARWPTVQAMAADPQEEVLKLWAGLGYYSRARNLHACAVAVTTRHAGRFPADEANLRTLPGIGAYTAAAVAAIAFDRRAVVVDGNVERVAARYARITTPLPAAKPQLRSVADALTPDARPGDFAQAMMDLGATICTPRRPACALCPLAQGCRARVAGDAETLPRKQAKAEKPLRRGVAHVVWRADGALLVRTRPEKGLLGGMTEVPCSPWTAGDDAASAPDASLFPTWAGLQWRSAPDPVRHVFTHFPLELRVFVTDVPLNTAEPAAMRFLPASQIGTAAFPTVMRKVLAVARLA